jgi:NTE family protein
MYKNIAFKGGGAKIFCSVGAVEALEEHGLLENIERVSGSSAGAVLALLVSLNMSANEIKDYLVKFDMSSEASRAEADVETDRFFNEYGRYSGDDIVKQAEELILEKTGMKNLTFKQLHDFGFKDLYITVTDLTNKKACIYSYEETPNIKIVDAVRISSTYPLYFAPTIGPNGEFLVDGGLINNYPIDIFDNPKFLPEQNLTYNHETIGIYLGYPDETGLILEKLADVINLFRPFNGMNEDRIKEYMQSLNVDNFENGNDDIVDIASYIKMLFKVGYSALNHVHHPSGEIFIGLDGLDVNTFDLDLSENKRLQLIEHGKNEALKFIQFDENNNAKIFNENNNIENLDYYQVIG